VKKGDKMKLSLYNLRKGFRYLKNYGLKEFFIRLKEKGADFLCGICSRP